MNRVFCEPNLSNQSNSPRLSFQLLYRWANSLELKTQTKFDSKHKIRAKSVQAHNLKRLKLINTLDVGK